MTRIIGPTGSGRRRRFLLVPILCTAALALFWIAGAQAVRDLGASSSRSANCVLGIGDTSNLPGLCLLHWGDTVTFNVSTTATTQPSVIVDCTQNGALVYRHYGFFYGDPSPSQNFVLQSPVWTSGAADCTATLYYIDPNLGVELDLSTLPFHVDA
jgi:hypothetical protein